MTEGKAPSIPATAIITFDSSNRSSLSNNLWIPATPTSDILSTLHPIISAVIAASVATGKSDVPAHATNIPGIFGIGLSAGFSIVIILACSSYFASENIFRTSSKALCSALVTITFVDLFIIDLQI